MDSSLWTYGFFLKSQSNTCKLLQRTELSEPLSVKDAPVHFQKYRIRLLRLLEVVTTLQVLDVFATGVN